MVTKSIDNFRRNRLPKREGIVMFSTLLVKDMSFKLYEAAYEAINHAESVLHDTESKMQEYADQLNAEEV
jgi:hypothetical protein